MSAELSEIDWQTRTAAYRHLIDRFEAPGVEELAAALDRSPTATEASLKRLEAAHQIVLAPGEPRIWMLHPFSAIPTDFPVEVDGGLYWGNCAWDAFGIPAVLGCDSRTETRCAESGAEIVFGIRRGQVEADGTIVHFAVPARHWYDNIAFT